MGKVQGMLLRSSAWGTRFLNERMPYATLGATISYAMSPPRPDIAFWAFFWAYYVSEQGKPRFARFVVLWLHSFQDCFNNMVKQV